MKHIFQFKMLFPSLHEQRLIFREMSNREDVLEEAERTGGTMEDPTDALEKLRAKTAQIAQDMKETRVTFWQRLNRFGNEGKIRKERLQERVEQEANRRLDEALTKGRSFILSSKKRAERKLLLQNIKKQILEDLHSYLQLEQKELQSKGNKYAKWSKFFGASTDPISSDQLQKGQLALGAIDSAKEEVNLQINGKEIPQSVQLNQQTEQVLREQLTDLHLIQPDAFDDLLESHFAGSNRLLTLLQNAPILKKNKALQKSLVRGAKRIRKSGQSSYRLFRLTQEDQNIGSIEDRLAKITENTSPGYPITFALGGNTISTRLIRFHGNQCILRDQANPKQFVILDRSEKAVTYRDSSGNVHDVSLTDPKMIVLNPNNSFSTAA